MASAFIKIVITILSIGPETIIKILSW